MLEWIRFRWLPVLSSKEERATVGDVFAEVERTLTAIERAKALRTGRALALEAFSRAGHALLESLLERGLVRVRASLLSPTGRVETETKLKIVSALMLPVKQAFRSDPACIDVRAWLTDELQSWIDDLDTERAFDHVANLDPQSAQLMQMFWTTFDASLEEAADPS